jgi:DNA modification methylase
LQSTWITENHAGRAKTEQIKNRYRRLCMEIELSEDLQHYKESLVLGLTAKVAWKKGNFVANTGRKSKNTEEIAFFTKGKARNLRPDAKKDKAEPGISHYMSGARGMLPTVFDIEPPGKNSRIHQAEKPVQLLQQILGFVTEEKEWVLNQFAGSFSLGEAALLNERNAICIEINEEYFEKGKERLLSAKSRSR